MSFLSMGNSALIRGIDYHLPANSLTNEDLSRVFPEWGADKIGAKTGIENRWLAGEEELSSDLAEAAARKLFARLAVAASAIDFVLFCSQTPDYVLPTTACLLQDRLGIPTTAGALDFNLGCSGFVYGLSLAKGLIETGQASQVLLLTGETYSKILDPADRSVRTIFGDAGAATLVVGADGVDSSLGPFVFGTDGSGAGNLICRRFGWRQDGGGQLGGACLRMNGPEIFNFTLRSVPAAVERLLSKSGRQLDEIDLFVFHQANEYMLEHLRKKMGIPAEKFWVSMAHCGNTVSNSIPIALRDAQVAGRLRAGHLVMLVGFGVGYSWGATLVKWDGGGDFPVST
jgi:3-oxoacyl-[acyl-carrier-protein] synthase-3